MATVLDTLVTRLEFRTDRRGLNRARQFVGNFQRSVARVAKRVAVPLAAVLGGFTGVSTRLAGNFEDALNQSLAIMGDVSEQMRQRMARVARDVATSTRFGAKDAAEAYFFLASAGLDAAQSIRAMPLVAKFAQAGMFDLALATDLLTDAQSALGLTVRDDAVKNMLNMARVSDVLVKANTLANATVQQFSESLTNRAGAALRIVNKDVEEGVAILAAYADQGVKGMVAGEQLNIVMRNLQKAALDNQREFAAAGIAIFDAEGNMRNFADILADLERHLEGKSDAEKRSAITTLGFQERSISALLTLVGTSDAIRTYEKELRNAQGTTGEVADKQLQSFNAQLDLLKSQLADVFIEIGMELLPQLKEMVRGIRDNMGAIRQVVPALLLLGTLVLGLAGSILGLNLAVKAVGVVFGAFKLVTSLLLFPLKALIAIVNAVRTAVMITGLVFGLTTLKVWLILFAIGILIAGLILLIIHWDKVVAFLRDVWDRFSKWFGEQMSRFGTWTRAQWDRLTGWIGSKFEALGTWLRGIWDTVLGWIQDRLAEWGLLDEVEAVAGWIGDKFEALGTRIREIWDAAIQWVLDRLADLQNAPLLGGVIQFAQNFIGGDNAPGGGIGPGGGPGGAGGLAFAAATPAPAPVGGTVITQNQNVEVSEGAVQVNAPPGASEEAIGRETAKAMQTEYEHSARDLDSNVKR